MEIKPQPNDIAYLRDNPDAASKFDKRFGEGAANGILNPTPTAQAAATPPAAINQTVSEEDVQALYDSLEIPEGAAEGPVTDTPEGAPDAALAGVKGDLTPTPQGALDTGVDVGMGVLNGVESAVNELGDAYASADNAMSAKLEEYGIPSRLQITDEEGNLDVGLKMASEVTPTDIPDAEFIREPVTSLGRFTSTATQFLAGMAGAGKITGMKGLVGSFVNGAMADGIIMDPDDPNLSSFMADNEYAIPLLTEALAMDPDDPEWVRRMKNMSEGVILGGVTEIALRGFRAVALANKASKVTDPVEAASLRKEAVELADEVSLEAEDVITNGATLEHQVGSVKTVDDILTEKGIVAEVAASRESLVNDDAIRAALGDKDLVDVEQISNSMWFNASKMDGPMEAQAMIEVAGDALARSGALEKLGIAGPQSFDSVIKEAKQELADMVGTGVDAFTARVAGVAEGAVEQGKFLIAGKMSLQSIGNEISVVAKRLDGMYALGKVDPEVEARLLDLMTTHANLQGHLKSIQTAAARATSLGRVRTNAGLDVGAMNALDRVAEAGGTKGIKDRVRQIRMAEGPVQQAAMIRSMQRGGIGKKLVKVVNEVFISNILSGATTHITNIAMNSLNVAVLPAERVLGGIATGSPQQVRMGLEQYAALRSSTLDSLRLMGRVLKTENPVLDTVGKVEDLAEGYRAISSEALGMGEGIGSNLVNGIGNTIRIPGRALMAEDEFFKQIMFRSRLKANLTVTASDLNPGQLKKLGYTNKGAFIEGETQAATMNVQRLTDEWDKAVLGGKVLDDPEVKAAFIRDNLGAANQGSKYAVDALRLAREATFTTPLMEGTITKSWQTMANRHPMLRQITPFIQTPANIISKSFDRIPGVNLLRTRYRDRLRSPDAAIRAEAAGEMATGVSVTAGLMFLANEGMITGGGPSDPSKRAMWTRDKNWQPYSLNMGSPENPEWVELKRLDPYFTTFGLVGDIMEMRQAAQDDPSFDYAGVTALAIASVTNNVTSKTWLQGVADVVEVMQSKDRPYVVSRFLQNRAAAFVPFSSAGRTYNQAMDETSREARGYIDGMKANIPGMSSDLPERFDWVDGQSIENPSKLLGFIKVREGDGNEVSQELRRLNYGFSGPDRKIGGVTLSSQQYQDWNRLMGTTTNPSGRTLEAEMRHVMDMPRYDKDRERVPDGVVTPRESHRVDMLSIAISTFKQRSRAQLLQMHPDLEEAWVEYERYKDEAESGNVPRQSRENLLLKF